MTDLHLMSTMLRSLCSNSKVCLINIAYETKNTKNYSWYLDIININNLRDLLHKKESKTDL